MRTLYLCLDCRASAFAAQPIPPSPPAMHNMERTTAPSWLLCSYPGKSGQRKWCRTGILPDMGMACGHHILHIPWDRHNSECTLHCSCVPHGFGRFQTSPDVILLFKGEYAPSVCVPCLPSSSGPWQTCVTGASSCSAEATVPTAKSEVPSYNPWSVSYACTGVCVYILCPPVPSFLEAAPSLLSQAHSSSLSSHFSLTLPED